MIDLGFEEIQKKLDHERAKEIHQMKIEEQNNQIKINNSEIDLNKIKIEEQNNHIKVNNSEIDLNKSKIELNNSIIELNNFKTEFWFW